MYSATQIIKVINKLWDNGIRTDKQIMNLTYGDLLRLSSLAPIERLIALEYAESMKNKKINSFFSGKKLENKEECDINEKK